MGLTNIRGSQIKDLLQSIWHGVSKVSIARLNRLFIGDAVVNEGSRSTNEVSWLGKKDYTAPNGTPQPNLGWVENNARMASYSSEGAIGLAGAAHNKEMPTGGAAIGVVGVGLNDNESGYTNNVWSLYLDSKRYPNAMGTTWCAEMAIVNHGSYVDLHDADQRGKTIGLSLVSGADPTINGYTEDCTVALAISSNGSKWGTGIAYPIGSLRQFTELGITDPYQKAMVMRNTQRLGWEDGKGSSLSYIQSRVASTEARVGVMFRDRAFDVEGAGFRALRLTYADGDTGTVRLRTASEADPRIRIGSEGLPHCSIALEASGTGSVTVNKHFTPAANAALNCGTTSLAWAGGVTQTAFQIVSDERDKMDISTIPDSVLDAWAEVDFSQFRYVSAVAEKGEGARLHFGVVAQRVRDAFEKHGVDPFAYGILCHEVWDAEYVNQQTNEGQKDTIIVEGKTVEVEATPIYEQVLAVPAGDRYTVRYEEALVLEAALMRRELKRLKACQ